MGDRRKKKTDPKEDLERYIEEEKKRKGSTLKDETLKRLIFSSGGPSVVDERRKEGNGSGGNTDSQIWADLELSLELAHEDYRRTYGTNLRRDSEGEEVYEDARSHFAPSATSPSSNSPLRIDPLSPNTSYAVDRMSRVSISSPAGAAPPPGYYPSNGQGVAAFPGAAPGVPYPGVPPQNTPLAPIVNQQPIHPPINQQPVLPPTLPNGGYQTNGVRVPYPPPMAPPQYIPQSMPLPPTVPNGAGPSRNGQGMPSTSSVTNPLFAAYSTPPSNHPYSIHPHASPYPPMPYPSTASRVPPQRTAEMHPDAMSRFLAQQQQMTQRMIAQSTNQMQFPPHMQQMQPPMQPQMPPPMHRPQQQQRAQPRPQQPQVKPQQQQQRQQLPPCAPSTSALPPTSTRLPSISRIATGSLPPSQRPSYNPSYDPRTSGETIYKSEYYKALAERNGRPCPPGSSETLEERVRRKQKRRAAIMAKAVAQMSNEELIVAAIEARNRQLKLKLIAKFGGYREDEDGNVYPPVRAGGGLNIFKGDKRFPLPPGKDMSFYVRPKPDCQPPPCPSPVPVHQPLEYVEEVPTCAEGKNKPLLCRGHSNTKERKEHTDYGGAYMQKIQHVFHSVTGDPGRVPNASTKGEPWENPFKEGEEPVGMEVYRKVKGRHWNPDYDYSPVFQQLVEYKERLWGYRPPSPSASNRKRNTSEERRAQGESLINVNEVPEAGNVFVVYPGSDYENDSDVSDCDDGRIAVGREELRRVFEERKRERERVEQTEIQVDDEMKKKWEEERKTQTLVRDASKKIHDGYYPAMLGDKYWGKISYYEKSFDVGAPYMCKWIYPKVYVDPHGEKVQQPDRFALSSYDRLDRDDKTQKVLMQPNMTFHFKCEPGGYLVLCSESEPPLFVQCPLYNAMMGEELDTIVRITKGHEMVIFDENFFNLLLHQAYQHGDMMMYEMRQMVLTRVSCTKGWGEAYVKSTILDALVWIEFTLLNAMKKIDTLLRGTTGLPRTKAIKQD